MVDRITKAKRSWIMSRIRSKNTKPELMVRSLLHRMGYRFRLHRKDLPGNPDIVLPKHKTVIFVHGCFWHSHKTCKRGKLLPKSHSKFWQKKFSRNVARDKKNQKKLRKLGWRIRVLWECELKEKNIINKLSKLFKKTLKLNNLR